MNPEMCKNAKLWQEAIKLYKRAYISYKDGKTKEAENQADSAWFSGIAAIYSLSNELKIPELTEILKNICNTYDERRQRHFTPEENIEWRLQALKSLSNALPPDTFPPLE
jgi:predicted transcriptional regulator